MPRAIVAGVPSSWAKQVKAALHVVDCADWSFKIFPSKYPAQICIDVSQTSDLARFASEDPCAAHIFAFGEQRDRAEISGRLRAHFRFRWLSHEILRTVPQSNVSFIEEIERVLAEENAWREALYPVHKGSVLTLPENGFVANPDVAAVWSMCEAFNREQGFFESLKQRLQRFESLHLKKWDRHNQRFFIDQKLRVWKDDGPYHGKSPFPRDWKYSSQLPDAFHYDVQHQNERSFEYVDRDQRRKAVAATGHCNVDAHGFLRD